MAREVRYTVHYLKAGSSNVFVVNRSAIAQFVVCGDGNGDARLRLFDVSSGVTSALPNATIGVKMTLRAKNAESFGTIGAAAQFMTGICASLSGTGARAMAFVRTIR